MRIAGKRSMEIYTEFYEIWAGMGYMPIQNFTVEISNKWYIQIAFGAN